MSQKSRDDESIRNSSSIHNDMTSTSSSSLVQLLVSIQQTDHNKWGVWNTTTTISTANNSNNNNTNDDINDNNDDDMVSLINDIHTLSIEERGMELRDAARYNDTIIVITILYCTAIEIENVNVKKDNNVNDSNHNDTTTITTIITSSHTKNNSNHNCYENIYNILHSIDPMTGNTALHMAAANNHCDIIHLLLQVEEYIIIQSSLSSLSSSSSSSSSSSIVVQQQQEEHSKYYHTERRRLVQCMNISGKNTPLHYAIQNHAYESIMALLLLHHHIHPLSSLVLPIESNKSQSDNNNNNNNNNNNTNDTTKKVQYNIHVDVLQRNAAGRSCLTEAFALSSSNDNNNNGGDGTTNHTNDITTQRNHHILSLLLEHPSASEEKLLFNNNNNNNNNTSNKNDDDTQLSDPKEQEQQTNDQLPPCHTHHFRFVGSGKNGTKKNDNKDDIDENIDGIELYIREMAMAPPISQTSDDNADATTTTTNDTTSSTTNFMDNDIINILGGNTPINDTTGYGIWSASLIMAQWMTDIFYHQQHEQKNRTNNNVVTIDDDDTPTTKKKPITILELGAGCGIPGITIAKSYQQLLSKRATIDETASIHEPQHEPNIYITDLNPTTLINLQYNIELNHVNSFVHAISLDWNEYITEPTKVWPWTRNTNDDEVDTMEHVTHRGGIDILIGSDLVYQKEVVPILVETIRQLRPKKFYYGAGKNRDGHTLFIETLSSPVDTTNEKDHNDTSYMKLVQSYPVPKRYRTTNPLYNQDDDECFIHFQDLLLLNDNINENTRDDDDSFTLYEFAWMDKQLM